MPRLLVVGNGMVGWKFCNLMVRAGLHRRWQITVLGEEPRPAYDRVHLTDHLAATASLELAPRSWYESNGIALLTGDRVIKIDRAGRTVTTNGCIRHSYDQLVLATGSRAALPDFAGNQLPGVFVYRTIEDIESIRDHARGRRHVTVMGGGLLGLEAARALMDLGLEAHVLERGSGLMARQLTPAASALLRTRIETIGVAVHSPRDTRAVTPAADGLRLHFADQTSLDTELLVVATGITPRDELAREAGLPCARRGGVEVDDFLQTADHAIFAIGECASHRGKTYGLVAPGYLMAEVLVHNLAAAGPRRRFTGSPLAARLKLLGVDVFSTGDFQRDAESIIHRTADTYRELILDNGHLVGALSVGPHPEAARLQDLAERRRWLSPWRLNRFRRTGRLWSEVAPTNPNNWPADAIVCSCKGITRGQLTAALREGHATPPALAAFTGASTVCGSCKPLLTALAGATPAEAVKPARSAQPLLVFSALAALLATALVLMPPLTYGQSIEHKKPWEFLYLDSWWRKATGFTVLGCAVLSLVLSLRKRIRWLALGSFGGWRVLHTVLGVGGLATLFAHTGLRLGDNFNRLLMLDFLGLVILGAAAGFITALEARLDPLRANTLRRTYTWAHIVLVWPLPPLVGFHILAAYYY
ncbi:MAG: FAD-dependent oxidoreductase [Verrucomicrobiota bacterium]